MINELRVFSVRNQRVIAFTAAFALTVLLLVIQGAAQPALNVWGNSGPNGYVDSVVVDPSNPNIIFATTQHGVFKSINYGAIWSRFNDGLGDSIIGRLVIDPPNPNTLYASQNTYPNAVFKTTNGGVNWTRTNFPGFWVLAVAPSDSRIIYGLEWTNFIVSTNGGETWSMRPFPDPFLYAVDQFVVDPQNPEVIYAFMEDYDYNLSGLFKSTNGGEGWTQLHYPDAFNHYTYVLKPDPSNINSIYAATGPGVYKSTDGGANWTLNDTLHYTSSLAVDPHNPGSLYAGVYGAGVHKSTDDGATWSPFNNGLTDLDVWELAIDSKGRSLHARTSTGVYSVRIREDSWTVGGRVLTPDGRGLRNATVSVTDPQGFVRTTTTSSFGLFSFDGIVTGAQYTISVASRFYRYTPQTVQVNDNLTLADFVGLE